MMMVALNKNFEALMTNHQRMGTDAFKPIVCMEGSARSGKTWSILEFLINLLAQHRLIATCFRYDGTTHKTSTIRDFRDIMLMPKYAGLWKAGHWNVQEKTFTFTNGSILEFLATNDETKLHGPERDIAWFNELEHHYEAYRQVIARTRHLVILDWNPSLSKHWCFERVLTREDVLFIHSTYKDNPHLAQKIIDEIEATEPTKENKLNGTADEYFWQVYGLGKRAKREGAVFKDWFMCEPEDWPERHICQRHGYGLDFGYSADDCVLVECALHQSRFYAREVFRETGLITCRSHANPNTRSIQGLLEENQIPKTSKIVADSARPEQIAELNAEGYCLTSCKKYQGSIVAGIDLLKRTPIFAHRHSTGLHQELDQYAWKRKPDGTWMNEPEDRFNHSIDAMRYWAEEELKRMAIERSGLGKSRRARKLRRY
jgi:phage terminase large subunit